MKSKSVKNIRKEKKAKLAGSTKTKDSFLGPQNDIRGQNFANLQRIFRFCIYPKKFKGIILKPPKHCLRPKLQ